jgi:hypothetical protein
MMLDKKEKRLFLSSMINWGLCMVFLQSDDISKRPQKF